ncbi:MAG: TRAP transporter substrate-binding protein [Kiloniellales bacterium]
MTQLFSHAIKGLCAGALLSVGLASAAAADKVTVNLGYAASETSPYAILADKFEELVEQYTDGSVDIKVRCCTQLATEDEAFKAMQLGTVDMFIITGNNISPHFPLTDAFVLPYIFQSKDHAYAVLDGDIGASFSEKLLEATGVHLLAYGFVGDRDFYNTIRKVETPADMEGLKIRVPKNEVMIDTFTEFGASPIPLAWAETPPALQTGAIDGADNGTTFIKSQKFYEIAKHLTILEHFNYFSPLLASDRVMNKFDDAQRAAVLRAAKEAGAYHRETMNAQIAEVRRFLGDEGGMTVTYPDKTPFIEAAKRIQDKYAEERGPEFTAFVKAVRNAAN